MAGRCRAPAVRQPPGKSKFWPLMPVAVPTESPRPGMYGTAGFGSVQEIWLSLLFGSENGLESILLVHQAFSLTVGRCPVQT